MRQKINAGNWKMNKTYGEALMLATEVAGAAAKEHHPGMLTILAPAFPFISGVARCTDGTDGVAVAAQNCHGEESGAYTGEVSVGMIISTGARYVIIGHSERRRYFQETDEILLKKLRTALAHGLRPVFCVGETLVQRDAGNHFDVIAAQLEQTVSQVDEAQARELIVAYEPVWAIGTGVNASAAQAQEMHAFIRKTLAGKFGAPVADSIPLLYGGSCTAGNCGELFACPDVDGGLIGGASLKSEEFLTIRRTMLARMA